MNKKKKKKKKKEKSVNIRKTEEESLREITVKIRLKKINT